MIRTSAAPLLPVALLLLTLPVTADIVRLRDGGTLRGRLTHEADAVLVDAGAWKVSIPRERILSIETEPDPIEVYARRRAALPDPPTADAWTQLGTWCASNGLPDQAREALTKAIRLEPDHEAARRALGHVRWKERWVTEDEFHAAIGDVKFRGRWMPREEMEAILEAEKTAREARALADRAEQEKREAAIAERRAREDAEREAAERVRREAVEARLRELEILRMQAAATARIDRYDPVPVYLYPGSGYTYTHPYAYRSYRSYRTISPYPSGHGGVWITGSTHRHPTCGGNWRIGGIGGGIRFGGGCLGTRSSITIRR